MFRSSAAFAAALCCAVVAREARPASETAPESVRGALQAAWQQHPNYRAVQAQLAAAQARLEAAGKPLYNPEVELTRSGEGVDRTSSAGLALALDIGGKRRARENAAAALLTLSEAEARRSRRDFARRWFDAWIDWSAAERRVTTGEQRVALMTRFADLAVKQFEADDISGLDRDVAALARDEAGAAQSVLVAERAEAEARLRALGSEPQRVADLPLPDDAPAPLPLGEESLQQLSEWQIADSARIAAEREIAVAERNRVPDPTLSLSGGRIRYGENGVKDDVFGVSISIPLFVRNNHRAEVAAARADADASAAEAERVRLELGAERRKAVDSYAATLVAWQSWKSSRGTEVARRAQLLERSWREGELSTSDYLLQVKQTLDTALAGAELEARLWRNYADYLVAGNRFERWVGLESIR
ncbi:TolC family protein [Dokdonella sp.]|uniref:TolC family protein n=1 Tax=Dokdonella sp. TaxID=2291710 RepID=UPI001B1D1C16|nr:TolC family protein [Dokdonella sp.]MBO9663106.1 TolC family protein [Dokdonella sp.]